MFRKKTTQVRRNRRTRNDKVLHLKVSSPRIVFFQSLKVIRGLLKTALILGIIGYIGVMAYRMVHKHFNDNKEFAIEYIPVTDFDGGRTVVLSQARVWEISGIDLKGSIFSPDLDEVRNNLEKRPEIIAAKVARKLPHTITIKIKERVPVAWLSCRQLGLAGRSPYKGILVDQYGVSFKSEKGFWAISKDLPVIEVKSALREAFPIGKKMNHADTLRALSFINEYRKIKHETWKVDRVIVENFYTLDVICDDGVEAKFSMHMHEDQLDRFIKARHHAAKVGEELAWIDLRPRVNNPFQYKSGNTRPARKQVSQIQEQQQGLDSTTRSILNRDN